MSTPRTSIIMPIYNTADTVVKSVESVLTQTDTDFELLIVIDASPDNSSQLLAEYFAKNPDNRVRVFDNKENRKLAGARNFGLDCIRGEWVAFIDSDDFYTREFLAKLHSASEGADVIAGAHTLVREDGDRTVRNRAKPGTYSGKDAVKLLLTDNFSPYAWDKIYKASLFRTARYQNIKRAEDLVTTLEVLTKADKVRVIDEPIYEYSVNPESLTWTDLTPIEECDRLIFALRKRLDSLLEKFDVEQAMRVQELLIYLNTAHQAIISVAPEARGIVKECRKRIRMSSIFSTLLINKQFALAGMLLKFSPYLYAETYKRFIAKKYGIKV